MAGVEEPPTADLLRAVSELNSAAQQVALSFEGMLVRNSALVQFIHVHKAVLHGIAVARGEASANAPERIHKDDRV